MFWKQMGKCIFFLFVAHKLITLSACLESADIKTLATARDLKANGHLNGGYHVYTKKDGKFSPRFGRLVVGRTALSYRNKVGLDVAREDGLYKKFSGYGENEERVENGKRAGLGPANATGQSYQQVSVPQNFSRTLKNSEANTESPGKAAREGSPDQSDNVSTKGWSSQSNGCTLGEINSRSTDDIKSSGSVKYQAGYQSDSALPGVEEGRLSQGEVTGILPGSGSPVNELWLRTMALVQCGYNNMSLTVRKSESARLMIDQGQTPPLSLSQLPSLCGYSVKTTWRDLVFTAFYDGCHVRQEDGSHVLSLIWWGTPVKMSCPILPAPTPFSLCCNPFGMTVTVGGNGSAADIGVDMGYEWRSLASVAQQCGYIVEVNPGKLVISVPFNTCGVAFKDGKYILSLQSGEKESAFSCPAPPSTQLSSSPPLLSTYSYPPLNPAPLTPPPAPSPNTAGPPSIPEHTPKFPMFFWHQPHYPAATPPDQTAHNPNPVDSPHLSHRVPVLYPQRPQNPLTHPEDPPLPYRPVYPPKPASTSRTPQIPVDPSFVIPVLHSHEPPNLHANPTARTLVPDDCETRDPTSARPPPPLHPVTGPSPPAGPPVPFPYYDLVSQLRPHNSQNPNNHFNTHSLPMTPAVRPSPLPPPPLPPSYQHSRLNQHLLHPSMDSLQKPHGPIKSPPHPLPFLPHHHRNPSFNRAKYPHPVHPCPAGSRLKSSVSPVPLTLPLAGPQVPPFFPLPSLTCKPKKMTITLPSAHPASIEVEDQRVREWIPFGSTDPDCSYTLYIGELGVLTFSSPLPACYSCTLSPSVLSLHVRYWDIALQQLQILDLKCLYSPGSTTQSPATEHPTAYKPQVYCMADHMSVRLPPGVWDVFVQDIKGNEIRLLETPEDCGYAVRKHGSDGTILTFPFTSCHMTNQDQKHTFGIKVLSKLGSQVQWLSCPLATPISKQDCGFPGDARQLCGPGCGPVGQGPCPDSGPCYLPTHGYMADGGAAHSEESPSIQTDGPVGVYLKIATDQNYTSYYLKSSQKFQNHMGRPLFLELGLVNAPDPGLALLVHYCLAYSISEQTPWIIYHSCPYPPQPPLPVPPSPVRKLTISTFEHLPPRVPFSPDEEIHFWCSTEVCSPSQRTCMEGCTI
ncbi:uncharacterized protein LOC135243198 isoform X1 [Anguilla rostrata]|uniref:uncharacterized protein LOC135243198 isoform X1 n=1 Tax=Anguilla rostrata TaxID=7938 RepID=UPI0030CF9481